MKKVTLVVALIISMTAFSKTSAASEVPGKTIGVIIEFGKKRLDCLKFGICRVTIQFDIGSLFGSSLTAAEERVAYGYATASKSSGISFRLIKDYMTETTRNEFFREGSFLVEEDFTLPDNLIKELGLKAGYTIRQGTYRYTENSKEIILIL